MKAILAVLYGLAAYACAFATLLYAIGFTGNFLVSRTLDGGTQGPPGQALVVDLLLLGLFAVQHSVMARPAFKRRWTRIVPESVERSTYVLAASAALALLLWQWQPIAEPVVWSIDNLAVSVSLRVVFWLGWAILLVATFLINHFELFGLQQVFSRAAGRQIPAPEFQTPFLYRHVRHPIYLGFLLAFWSTPHMTAGHLLFAVAMTGYILIGVYFEERDLMAQFGDRYRRYREQVGMLFPWPGKTQRDAGAAVARQAAK